MVCLLNSCLYVMFRSCFEGFFNCCADQTGVRRALRCATPRIAVHRTYMGSCGKKNDWQFSNPRIDTGAPSHLRPGVGAPRAVKIDPAAAGPTDQMPAGYRPTSFPRRRHVSFKRFDVVFKKTVVRCSL